MQVRQTELDIIVPCYNPLKNWEEELYKNFTNLNKSLTEVCVGLILINDGSTDNVTKETIFFLEERLSNFKYIDSKENRGKGSALRLGVESSVAKHIIFTDIDFPYELNSMFEIYKSLQTNADVSLGNRNLNYYEKTPLIRKIISKTFRAIMKLLLNLETTDTQCGLKGFNEKGKKEFLKTTINRFLFDLEFVKLCSNNKNIIIRAIPVKLKEGIVFSKMNFKILLVETFNFLFILIKK